MRRKDREMNEDFALSIIDKSSFGTIALWDDEAKETYSIPLSIVRKDKTLYFHSATSGRKVSLLKAGDIISASFVGDVEVPDCFSKEELTEIAKDQQKISLLISRVFTTQFESTVVSGPLREIIEEEEKKLALKIICEKYTPDKMDFFEQAVTFSLQRVKVFAIDLQSISGKRKKLDSSGEEMKWGRME